MELFLHRFKIKHQLVAFPALVVHPYAAFFIPIFQLFFRKTIFSRITQFKPVLLGFDRFKAVCFRFVEAVKGFNISVITFFKPAAIALFSILIEARCNDRVPHAAQRFFFFPVHFDPGHIFTVHL